MKPSHAPAESVTGRWSAILITTVFLAAPGGCAGPEEGVVYRLARVGNDTLPVVLQEEQGCRHVLTGGEVTFSGRGEYASTYRIEKRCAAEPPSVVPDPGGRGSVRIAGDTAYFSNEEGQGTGYGVLTADTLVVRRVMRTLRYHRVYGDEEG
jgi:hypothetical protein